MFFILSSGTKVSLLRKNCFATEHLWGFLLVWWGNTLLYAAEILRFALNDKGGKGGMIHKKKRPRFAPKPLLDCKISGMLIVKISYVNS